MAFTTARADIVSTGEEVTYLANFSKRTGGHPTSQPILAEDGTYYGVVPDLSRHDVGAIYQLTPEGTLSVLHIFNDNDGANPFARLVQADDGALYGTTYNGGHKKSCGTVFRYALDGNFDTLHVFNCKGGGAHPAGGVIQGQDGLLYGMTESGGKHNGGIVYKLDLNGTFRVLANFGLNHKKRDPVNCGTKPIGELTQTHDGTFFGTTSVGGGKRGGALFSMSGDGQLTHRYGFSNETAHNGSLTYVPTRNELIGTEVSRIIFAYDLQRSRLHAIAAVPYGGTALPGSLTLGIDGQTLYGFCGNEATGGCIYSLDSSNQTRLVAGHIKGTAQGQPTFDAPGDIIGVTSSSGKFGDGAAFELATP